MEDIARQLGRRFSWTQNKSFVRSYELRRGQFLYATLKFHSDFSLAATGTTRTGSWLFDQVGFLNPRIEIFEKETSALTGSYNPKFWGDGILKISTGENYLWSPQNFWRTSWGFFTENDQSVYTLSPGSEKSSWRDIFKNQAIVELAANTTHLPELPLLIVTGWYLTNLQQADSAATVATISATSAV